MVAMSLVFKSAGRKGLLEENCKFLEFLRVAKDCGTGEVGLDSIGLSLWLLLGLLLR